MYYHYRRGGQRDPAGRDYEINMSRYKYKAKRGPKGVEEGVIEAESNQAAILKLGEMGLYPLSIEEETGRIKRRITAKRVSSRDLALFTREFANLLESGLTPLRALTLLTTQTENKALQGIIPFIHEDIKEGKSLAEAFSNYPRIFNNLYVSMVNSGEVSGALEEVLKRLADFSEAEDEIRAKVKAALSYPVLMAGVGIITIFVLLTFVIPKIVSLFSEMGQALPLPTLILIAISNFFVSCWWGILAFFLISFFIFRRWGTTAEGKLVKDTFKLKIPLFGRLLLKTEIARFSRTMATLLRNGVSILKSLEVVRNTINNEVISREINNARTAVAAGKSISQTFAKEKVFPVFVSNLLTVGEEGGALENAFYRISEVYEREVDRHIKVVTSMLEPIIILIMGSIVGFIVISLLLPIFEINLLVR